jgi:cytosine deaminase
VAADREAANWSAADVRARMAFATEIASRATARRPIRTHIDSLGKQIGLSWPVLAELRAEWAGRIAIQGSPLFGIQFALDEGHVRDVVAAVKAHGDRLFGCVSYMIPELDAALDAIFRTAIENGLPLDFHVDETMDPAAHSLRADRRGGDPLRLASRVTAGSWSAIAARSRRSRRTQAERTLDRQVAEAGLAVVSLPMCNMYLQDRTPGRTPRRRGVTAAARDEGARHARSWSRPTTPATPSTPMATSTCWRCYARRPASSSFDHPVADWPMR